MAICVALERRSDLKIIASEREILRVLPGISSRPLFVEPWRWTPAEAAAGSRAPSWTRWLAPELPGGDHRTGPTAPRGGHAGRLVDQFQELLVRLVPATVVLPIAVSGVISRAAHRHPMVRRFADPAEREWAAATLQVLCRHMRRTKVRVAIGEPISMGEADPASASVFPWHRCWPVPAIPSKSALGTCQRRLVRDGFGRTATHQLTKETDVSPAPHQRGLRPPRMSGWWPNRPTFKLLIFLLVASAGLMATLFRGSPLSAIAQSLRLVRRRALCHERPESSTDQRG